MQGVHQDTVADSHEQVDTPAALWLLASLAGFYRQPFDAELVIKRFPPPIDLPTLIEAMGALGLKAGLVRWPEAELSALPLPAVALLSAPASEASQTAVEPASAALPQPPSRATLTPALIVQHGDDTLAWVKPGQSAPETVALGVARAQAAPVLLLVAQTDPPVSESVSRAESPEAQKKPLGFSWFVPELLRHKSIWRDVLLTDFGAAYLSERYRTLIAEWSRKLHVLEAFNGQYFFNLPEMKSQTEGANDAMWEQAA